MIKFFHHQSTRTYLGESKVLQYFANEMHNLAAPGGFAKIDEPHWIVRCQVCLIFVTHWICFFSLEHSPRKACFIRLISLVGRVFVNGPGDLGSIPSRIILKTLKMVLDPSLEVPVV